MKRIILFLLMLLLCVPAIAEEKSIIEIKTRLQELGYYVKEYTPDERTNDGYTRRVKQFQTFNGLDITGEADDETVAKLFSESALSGKAFHQMYNDDPSLQPELTLYFPETSHAQWSVNGSELSIGFQVKNMSPDRVVQAHELTIYAYDPWEIEMIGDGNPRTLITIADMKPGVVAYSSRFKLQNRTKIFFIYAGISKVRYEDGTIVEVPEDEILYYIWQGPFNGS